MILTRITNRNSNQTNGRRGVAAIEMAIVAPFVFLVIFASMEFARMMMVRQALTNAVREGCRHAALSTTETDDEADTYLRSKLRSVVGSHSDPEKLRITIDPEFSNRLQSGTEITASAEVNCEDVSWLPPIFFGGAQIRSSATMARE